jgi:hypothetical protein
VNGADKTRRPLDTLLRRLNAARGVGKQTTRNTRRNPRATKRRLYQLWRGPRNCGPSPLLHMLPPSGAGPWSTTHQRRLAQSWRASRAQETDSRIRCSDCRSERSRFRAMTSSRFVKSSIRISLPSLNSLLWRLNRKNPKGK